MAQRLTHSDAVEVLYDDGWWLMTFLGTRPSAHGRGMEYNVRSDMYQVERWVAAEEVRPHWKRWGSKWRQLEQLRKEHQPKAAPLKTVDAAASKTGRSGTSVWPKGKAERLAQEQSKADEPANAGPGFGSTQSKASSKTRSPVTTCSSHLAVATGSTGSALRLAPALKRDLKRGDLKRGDLKRERSSQVLSAHVGSGGEPVALKSEHLPALPKRAPVAPALKSEHLVAILEHMEAREDASWFAHPVSWGEGEG